MVFIAEFITSVRILSPHHPIVCTAIVTGSPMEDLECDLTNRWPTGIFLFNSLDAQYGSTKLRTKIS